MRTRRARHCSTVFWLHPEPTIKSSSFIKAQGTPMQLLRFISKYKFSSRHQADKKLVEWWKIIVTALAIIATGLLLATYVLSGASMKRTSSQENNNTSVISSMYSELRLSKNNLTNLRSWILPMAQVYCSIQSCLVTCSLIPAASNPGIIAAIFVDFDYESNCPDHVMVEELIFDNCRFTSNALSSEWFPAKSQLRKLTFRGCSLTVIDPDAFSTEQFEALSRLAIIDNGISVFQKSLFDALTNLEELVIMNNVIQQAEADLLSGTANALQILQINNAIYSQSVLINITGKNPLPNLLLLSLARNSIDEISAEVFKGVPNVQSVYLTDSGVSSIGAGAFDPFSNSVRQLFLADNKISFLPSDVFQSILKVNSNFMLTLANNDWNCSCESQWLQNLTTTRLILADEPRCATPDRNTGLKFSEATFCHYDTSRDPEVTTEPNESTDLSQAAADTTKPTDPEDEVTPTDNGLISLMCVIDEETPRTSSRRLLAVQEFNFRTRNPAFSVEEQTNGSVYVNLITTLTAYTLVWFDNDEANLSFESIKCITNVRNSLYLNHLRSGGLYTICLLNMFGDVTSPFNCLSFRKRSDDDESLWLANEDKTMIYSGLSCILVFVCVASVIGSYCVVRRNPRLLKGSKRIIMVRHRAADAIVLPEGLRLDLKSKDFVGTSKGDSLMSSTSSQKDYMTPVSKRRLLARKCSVISGTSSRSSANSYVSGIEPTTMQLMSWRIKRIRDNFSLHDSSDNDDSPPPLPPPRNKSIPSLSLNVDERETSNDQTMTTVFTPSEDRRSNFNEERL